jgi:MarR family transcriptional regulator, organic hydroperoxide resistance regulator
VIGRDAAKRRGVVMGAKTIDEQLCYAIYSAGLAINRIYKPFLDELGITYPQYLAMCVLWETDGMTIGAIGDRLSLETSTLTPLLKRLENIGFIDRIRSKSDERQVVVTLTSKGDHLRERAQCLPMAFQQGSGLELKHIVGLNDEIRALRDNFAGKSKNAQ